VRQVHTMDDGKIKRAEKAALRKVSRTNEPHLHTHTHVRQVHTMDDGKMRAEKAAREAVSRTKELEERLTLLSTLHKLDLGKLQFRYIFGVLQCVLHVLQ